jgi:hypothetical protein
MNGILSIIEHIAGPLPQYCRVYQSCDVFDLYTLDTMGTQKPRTTKAVVHATQLAPQPLPG